MIIEMDKAYMDAHLFRAAVTGNVRVLDEAENSEVAYLYTRSPHQNNILHIAAQHGQVKFIEQALKRFPTEFIHEKNLDEDTPLHVAAEYGNAESVKLLITHLESQMSMISESGSENTNTLGVVYYMVKNKQGDTPFHVALRHASFEAAVELFDAVVTHHPEILSTVNHLGETPLHLYVRCCAGQRHANISKNRWICEGVLNSKGIYGFRDKKSGTIMFKMLSRLVSAYVFAACLLDNEGLTPVLTAAKTGNLRDVLYLLNSCPQAAEVCDASGSTVLHLVKAHPDDYMELKKLIDLPEINILKDKQDCDGNTAGHIAVEHRDYAKIRLLSESLADFTITNNRGLSVGVLIHQQPPNFLRNMEIEMRKYRISTEMHIKLHWEAMTGNVESFAYWRYNADKYFLSRTMEGSSILHVAIENGHLAYVEDALKHYPSLILTRDFRGNTPLHIAARFDNLAAKQVVRDCKRYVELVSEHLGLPIEVTPWETKNSLGHTPLHEALRTNNIEIALELMKLKDRWQSCYMDDSESPLHKLARYAPNTVDKVQTLEQLIQENNWAMFHRDSEGLTPLLRAAQCGRFLLALLILQFNPQSMDSRDWGGKNFLHHLRLVNADVEEKEAAGWLCSYIFKIPQMLDILSLTQDHNGNTPLHQTILDGEFDVALLMMIEWSVKMEPKLILAIRNNEGKCVMDLILTGLQVPVNLKELVKQAAAGNILEEKIYDASSKGDESLFQLQRPTYAKDSDNEEIKHANDDGRPSSTSDSETPEASNRGHNDDNNIDDKCLMCQTRDGSNIIHIAIQHGQTSFMERALAIFPNLIFQKDLNGDTPLHIAARLRNAAALKCLELACRNWLYKAKEDSVQRASLPPWMIKNSRGNTLFHEAARTSNYQAVSIVMEYATIEAFSNVNENGETVLHLLARYGTYDAVDKLEELAAFVRHGCSFAVYIRDFDGLTPFIRAVKCGRMRLASFIRQYHPQSAQIRGYKGRTPLHHLELSPVDLVDDSEDIGEYCTLAFGDSLIEHLRTTTDEDGNTPLHLAIMRGNIAVAKFLMGICLKSERRQELTIVNKDGYSILGLLSSQGHIPDMKKLQESMGLSKRHVKERALLVDKKMDDVIYQAVIKGNVQILEEKLTEESDVENGRVIYKEVDFLRQTPDGSSLLHIALRHGKEEAEEFVDKLLDRFPALVLHTDSDGDTPLHVAAKLHSPLSKKFLGRAIEDHNKAIEGEKRGVYLSPLKVKNSMGNTPIHEALLANNAYAAAIMISIEPGTASNVNDFGETPLHVYARYGLYYSHEDHTEYNIVKDLITQDNSTAFMRDDEGLTPLLRAARCGRFRVTRRILEHCPQSAYLRDPNGRTFLHHLRFTGGDVSEFSADYIFEWMGKKLFEIPEADVQRLVQDADGDTPLHYTIKTRNFIAAEVLTRRSLETGRLEFGRLNNNGETVLDLLASHDAPNEIIKLIRKETSGVMYTTGSTFGIRKAEIKESTSALSVIAGLLATITFAAALQVPGGFDSDDGSPILLRTAAFQIFLVSDAIAMCASMIVLFFLLWVMACSKIHDSYILLDLSMTLLQASFYATLLAFMTGVYVATAHKTLWMAIIVCALCSIVILITWRTIILYLVKKIRLLIDIFITVKGFSFKKFKKHMGIYLGINDSP